MATFSTKNISKTHINFKIIKIWPFLKVEKDAESVAAFFFLRLFFLNHHPPIDLVWDYYSRNKWPWELSYFKSLGERGGGIGNRRIIQLFGHSVREGAPPIFSRHWGVPAAHAQGSQRQKTLIFWPKVAMRVLCFW